MDDIIRFKIDNIDLETKLSEMSLQKVKTIDGKISILEVLNEENLDRSYMAVVNNNQLKGVISQTDILNSIDPEVLIKKQSIEKLIANYKPFFIQDDKTIIEAITVLQEQKTDAIIVKDNFQAPIGIFTTKDFIRFLKSNNDINLPVKHMMSSPLEAVDHHLSVSEALSFIQNKHFKRLIVKKDHEIIGLITQSQLLKIINHRWIEVIKQRGEELSQLNESLLEKTIRLEKLATHDYLTDLFNRSKLDSMLNYELHQVRRYTSRNLSVLLFDIDNFKKVNDTYGHDVGDEILQKIARILTVSSRESDIVARWGGEEFFMMLPETNIEQALVVAEKIRLTIEHTKFNDDIRITCSCGIAQFRSSDDIKSLFKRVDEALYNAKESGKNQVKIESV
jgi:diguanylate cyclase (GGDEF)-like protein